MKIILAAVLFLAACGPEIENPIDEAQKEMPTTVVTPNGVEVLPPGWFLHFYPAYCVVLVRDEQGEPHRCYDYSGYARYNCEPTSRGGCRHFGF